MVAANETGRIRSRDRVAALSLALLLCVACATGRTPTEGAGWEPAQTSWGDPVIEGTWDYRNLTPMERPPEFADKPVFTREEAEAYRAAKVNMLDSDNRAADGVQDLDGAYNAFWLDWGSNLEGELRTSLIVDPPDGRLPEVLPEARAAMEEQIRDRKPPVREISSGGNVRPLGPEWLGTSERCLIGVSTGPPMVPSSYNNNVRIVQTPDYVLLVNEMVHDPRIIPMDRDRPRRPKDLPSWLGESRAWWEGDTLVVETANFTDKTSSFKMPLGILNFSYEGSVGSAVNMHLIERFTPIAEGRLRYEFTVDDPKSFARPFTVQYTMRPTEGPMFEYACHEGNYAVENTLKAIRYLESQGK